MQNGFLKVICCRTTASIFNLFKYNMYYSIAWVEDTFLPPRNGWLCHSCAWKWIEMCLLLFLCIAYELREIKYLSSVKKQNWIPVEYSVFLLQCFYSKSLTKNPLEEQLWVFTDVNLTLTSLQTVLYHSTPGEQNCFVWPAFKLSPYLQPSTVVGLFQQGLPCRTAGTEPFLALCAWFVKRLGTTILIPPPVSPARFM